MRYPINKDLEGYSEQELALLGDVELRRGEPISTGVKLTALSDLYVSTALGEDDPVAWLIERIGTLEDGARRSPRRDSREWVLLPDRNLIALAEIMAVSAREDEGVQDFRRVVLRGRLLKRARMADWIVRKVKEQGQPTRVETIPVGDAPQNWGAISDHRFVEYDTGDGEIYIAPVAIGGPLWHLHNLVKTLCSRFDWESAETTRFVLTNESPGARALVTARRTMGSPFPAKTRIILSISPRASPDDVKRIYAAARESEPDLPKRARTISEHHAALAVFVAEHGQGQKWGSLMKRWNAEHREWAYEDVRPFNRDAHRAYRRVTGSTLTYEGDTT